MVLFGLFFLTSTRYLNVLQFKTQTVKKIFVTKVTELMLDPSADTGFVKIKIVLCDTYVSVISVYVSKEKSFEHIAVRRNNVIYGSIVPTMGKLSSWAPVESMSWNVIPATDESCV